MSPVCQTAQYIVKLLISKHVLFFFITCSVFFVCFFFKRELVHRKESFKSPFQYKFITAIQFETYYHQVNKIYKEKLVEICLMN